jgi:ubiquinone/menaquinone biosynthesis C-methylase UbiE
METTMAGSGNVNPTERVRGFYQRYAPRYDRETSYYDRFLLGDRRAKLCGQARGSVLEVAIGTGRNLPFYPRGIQLTGIDFTAAMLEIARDRAHNLGMQVDLIEADAQSLPFDDATFDTVVCTLALNAIPNDRAAIAEMYRILRPTGRLLLLGHVASNLRFVRAMQRWLERKSLPIAGDYQTRQPMPLLPEIGFTIDHQERARAGIIQTIIAVKPAT